MKKYFLPLLALVLFCLCLKDNAFAGSVSATTSASTVGAEEIASFNAVLKGRFSLESNTTSDIMLGFRYSTNSVISVSNSSVIEAKISDTDAQNNFKAIVPGLKPATKYYFLAFIRINGRETWGNTMDFTTLEASVPKGAVDLGIVMTREDGTTYNLYWAKCNVGASKPEEYGNYYAWGETELKLHYDWSTYKWCNGTYESLTKYKRSLYDQKVELEIEDDVANQKLGGKWRMPTDAEWKALIEHSVWKWTKRNGINGSLVTADNGNSIFLPAAGSRLKSGLYEAGSEGYYWSSSLYTDGSMSNQQAMEVDFNSYGSERSSADLCLGFSVRPVYEE